MLSSTQHINEQIRSLSFNVHIDYPQVCKYEKYFAVVIGCGHPAEDWQKKLNFCTGNYNLLCGSESSQDVLINNWGLKLIRALI